MTLDPLVEALARTILRHQLGCDQPAEPPAWMVAAATEIVDALALHLVIEDERALIEGLS